MLTKIEDPIERKRRFLNDLCRRGPEAYNLFSEVLYGVDQVPAARILRPSIFTGTFSKQQVMENITSSPLTEVAAEVFPSGGVDSGDHSVPYVRSPTSTIVCSIENPDLLTSVKKCKKEMKGANIYRMRADPRGYCLIFNTFKYLNDCYPQRAGSEAETKRMTDVFTQLHFNVEVRENQTKDEMEAALKDFSKRFELSKHDAFILMVLSHGHSGYVVAADGVSLHFNDIIKRFNNENSPHLINKPKLFFFNCCRGDTHDLGPKFVLDDFEDAVSDARSFDTRSVPLNGDMMICYSTIDGYVSWRNENTGSWFGTALCQSLAKQSHSYELHAILTTTSHLVNNKSTSDGEKQVMEHSYRGWKKLFYFNPGIAENRESTSSPIC
ncbi:unnamed protein product [Medioppia subpectinata]|uniref:Uncharacterized protein n=1 Tax=Medioppia subpectinata TaxID=1979941 RepID=A0A7R9KUD7_9ACAR|nr:unnamed protein product [Medioppia subpectinata]CAG2108883.1 unnamed protein product [Medioppia subpectinata]